MSIERLGQYLGAVEDPRCSGKIEHRLVDVLVIAVCAVIACAESWDDIALYGRSKLARLRAFLKLANSPERERSRRHSLARHVPARVHADRPRCLRDWVRGLGRLAHDRL